MSIGYFDLSPDQIVISSWKVAKIGFIYAPTWNRSHKEASQRVTISLGAMDPTNSNGQDTGEDGSSRAASFSFRDARTSSALMLLSERTKPRMDLRWGGIGPSAFSSKKQEKSLKIYERKQRRCCSFHKLWGSEGCIVVSS